MKAPSPAFSYYPKDVASDEHCSAMTHEEFGMYIRLLGHAWLEGSIPADPIKLQRLLHIRPAKLTKAWKAIGPCWEPSPGDPLRLVQGRIEIERAKQIERNLIATASATSRWSSKDSARKPNTSSNGAMRTHSERSADAVPTQCYPSPSPSPSPVTEEQTTYSGERTPVTSTATDARTAPDTALVIETFPSARAVDVYRRHRPGAPNPAMFRPLRALATKHGWAKVEPEMEAYLATHALDYENWPKFASGFGEWASGHVEANGNGKATIGGLSSDSRRKLSGIKEWLDEQKGSGE